MNIDYERLREDLKDYYGTAMVGAFPMAVMDLGNVENASHAELIAIARKEKVQLEKYQKTDDNQANDDRKRF